MRWGRSQQWWGWYCELCQSYVNDRAHFLGPWHRKKLGQTITHGGVPDPTRWTGGGDPWKLPHPPTRYDFGVWVREPPLAMNLVDGVMQSDDGWDYVDGEWDLVPLCFPPCTAGPDWQPPPGTPRCIDQTRPALFGWGKPDDSQQRAAQALGFGHLSLV